MDVTAAPIIKTATVSDESRLFDILTLAFAADPTARWVWPDPQEYITSFPRFAKAFGGRAFEHGSAYYLGNYSATSLWLPPNIHPDVETIGNLLQSTASEQAQKDGSAVFEQMRKYHPSEPHWYLPLMGVDPLQQGKGFGSELMKYVLKQCDHDNRLAYLESSNPRNVSFYKRLGFEAVGSIQAGSSPSILPMVRKPRQ
jgi:GNAT superfamily N-acetyltransferase